jgi:hypothetical protein
MPESTATNAASYTTPRDTIGREEAPWFMRQRPKASRGMMPFRPKLRRHILRRSAVNRQQSDLVDQVLSL